MESLEVMNPNIFRILPENDIYTYRIVEMQSFPTELNPNAFNVTLRVNISTKESVLLWLNEFKKKNYLTLRVLNTFEENTQRRIFKKTYRCVHNTRPKKGSIAHPKHLGCTAKVAVTLKNPKIKRTKDVHIKTHPCEVYIRHTHNHSLYDPTVLKYPSPSEEDANICEFATGEECKLEDWYGDIDHTTNNSFTESQEQIDESLENNEIEVKCENDNTETLEHFRAQLDDIFNDVLHKAANNLEEYKKPLEAFIKNFYSCKTDSSLISALNNFGKYSGAAIPVIKRGKNTQREKRIGFQPPKLARLSDHCYSKESNIV